VVLPDIASTFAALRSAPPVVQARLRVVNLRKS
jgi:hypothetical protein